MRSSPARLLPLLVLLLLFAACSDAKPVAFTSGVAAGDARPDGAVLWARVDREATLTIEVAADESFSQLALEQEVHTNEGSDFTAQAAVSGLTPATQYYYRFRHDDTLSATGMFRTAPAVDDFNPVRFVFSGGTDGSGAFDFHVLETALADDPDFFVYEGDTIAPGADSLDTFRARYRENRTVAPLADLLAATSTYAIWDDNEVAPDFAGTTVAPEVLAAGRQAFLEYLPLGGDATNVLYRRVRWGSAVELFILDTRSYRDDNVAAACTATGASAPDVLPALGAPAAPEAYRALRTAIGLPAESGLDCLNALSSPGRTMLGREQREWLLAALADSDATFKFIVAPAPIAELVAQPYDRWEGYRAERDAVVRFIADRAIDNVVFLSTGLQASIISDVRVDLASPAVAVEAVAGPIAAETLGAAIARTQGERAIPVYEQLLQQVARVSCTAFDAYSYGLVEVDPAAGTATITLKDEDGAQLCRTVLAAAGA